MYNYQERHLPRDSSFFRGETMSRSTLNQASTSSGLLRSSKTAALRDAYCQNDFYFGEVSPAERCVDPPSAQKIERFGHLWESKCKYVNGQYAWPRSSPDRRYFKQLPSALPMGYSKVGSRTESKIRLSPPRDGKNGVYFGLPTDLDV